MKALSDGFGGQTTNRGVGHFGHTCVTGGEADPGVGRGDAP